MEEVSSHQSRLLQPLMDHFISSLPSQNPRDEVSGSKEMAETNRAAIIKLSVMSMSNIITPLAQLLQLNMSHDSPATKGARQESQLILLDTMTACLEHQWDVKGFKAEPVETSLVDFLSKLLLTLLNESSAEKMGDSPIHKSCKRLIRAFSLANFAGMYRGVEPIMARLASGMPEEQHDLGRLLFVEHMHFTTDRLCDFLRAVAQTISAMKKQPAFLMANYVCTAIDSWLKEYPGEFVGLHERGSRPLVPECASLFTAFGAVAEKTVNRKVVCWPAQMRTLLLCPNLISHHVSHQHKSSPTHKFIDSLRKAMSSTKPPLYETSLRVFVCAIIAAAYLDASSPLHVLLLGVEADLKERVFSSSQPFFDSFTNAEEELLVPSLVAFFRLNHKSTVNDLMERFLSHEETPLPFQIAAVKALIQIAPHAGSHAGADKASPRAVQYCHQKLSRPLRRTLNRVVRELKTAPAASSSSKPTKKEQSAHSRTELLNVLLGALLELFRIDPAFAFHHENGQHDGDGDDMWYGSQTTETSRDKLLQDTQIMFHNLCACALEEKLSRVADQAVATLVRFHSSRMIPQWRSGQIRFWEVSSDLFITIATHVTRFARGNERFVLRLLKTLMSLRNNFVRTKRAYFLTQHELGRWKAARTQLELVALTNLCSVDREVVVTTKDCIGLMCEEASLLDDLSMATEVPEALAFSLPVNHDVFSDIAKLQLSAASAGLRATHKQIVKVLRDVVTPTKGTESAWELIFRRTKSVLDDAWRQIEDTSLPGKEQADVKPIALPPALPSMLYFLCSLGGVCNIDCIGKVKGKKDGTTQTARSNKEVSVVYLTSFVNQLLMFLEHDSDSNGVELRETIKDALGHELHAVLVPFVFDQLLTRLCSYFDKEIGNYTTNASRTTFVDQAIGVIHLNFQTDNLRTNQYLALADMESLLDAIMEYLRQVSDDDHTRRVKIGFCKLVVMVMQRRNLVTFKQEMRFRNKLLDRIISFVSTGNAVGLSSTVLLDLDIAAVQALAALLHGLPLQPLDDDVADPMQVRSTLFLKYFTFLMNVTNRCNSFLSSRRRHHEVAPPPVDRDAEPRQSISRRRSRVFDEETASARREAAHGHGHHSRKRQTRLESLDKASAGVVSAPHKFKMERIERLYLQLRDSVTHAMSNLLGANVEVGLSHAISMGYHQDAEVRLAFTEVLNKVLHQGAEFDMLSETVVSDRYAKLLMLITKPDLQIVFALDRSMPTECLDDLAQVLVRVFHSRRRLVPLCVRLAEAEVMSCRAAQSIFRRNSLATKVCTAAIRSQGREYLKRVISPMIMRLVKENNSVFYEIDEAKLPAAEKPNVDANAQRLLALAQGVLDTIFATIDSLPESLRAICWDVRRTSESLFPEAGFTAVGGLVFLRFFTPAIVSPVSYEILPPGTKLPVNALRALLLLSKMLQALANFAPFSGVKEPFMTRVNSFVEGNLDGMQRYLTDVADPTALSSTTVVAMEAFNIDVSDVQPVSPGQPSGDEDEMEPVTDADLHALHRMVFENLEQIGQDLAANMHDIKDVSSLSSSLLFDQLATLLAQLGDPPKATTTQGAASFAAKSQENKSLEDFLARHEFVGTSTEDIEKKQVFFRSGMSKDKRPVFYLIARRYKAAEIDGEQLLYFIFLTLKPLLSAKFDLVLDLTAFSRQNEPSELVLAKFLAVVPPSIVSHIGTAYFVNASSSFKQFAKRVARHVTASKFHKVIRFLNEVELQEHVRNPALPASTFRLTEATDVITNVTLHQTNKKTIPVVFKVGSISWQLVSAEKVKLFTHSLRTVDIFPVANLVDVLNSGMTDDGHVRIVYSGGESLSLSCNDLKKFDDAVSEAWTRYLLSQPENKKEWKVMRPADVPATLLNMALLNLGSANAKLRLASYNLLANATTTFNFHIGGEVLEASGIVIPENNNNFIIRISECLSRAEPGLTLEFLDECITGIRNSTSEQKHICLEYMQPWLPRLCEDEATSDKVAAIIKGLVDMTIHEKDLYPSLQATVWSTVARVDDLARLVIREFMQTAVQHGPETQAAELLADAAVSLGSVNASLVAREVIGEVLRVLRDTGSSPAKCLSQHKLWPRLRVLARFLLKLSFNNCLDVARNLADIWFIVTMLVAVGRPSMRAVMHAVVTNVTQSLCTSLQLSEESTKALLIQLSNMSLPKLMLQFGLSTKQALCDLVSSDLRTSAPSQGNGGVRGTVSTMGKAAFTAGHSHQPSGSGQASLSPGLVPPSASATAVPSSSLDASGTAARAGGHKPVGLASVQAVVDVLHEIVSLCDEHADAWRQRWLKLLLGVARDQGNPVLRPRAFVALGVITQDTSAELMSLVLGTLSTALAQQDTDLADAILACLARLQGLVKEGDFDYHMLMFWVSLAILQAGVKELYSSALSVLETTVKTMEDHGVFASRPVADVVLDARQQAGSLFDKLEMLCGLSFTGNFSFAMSATLLRAFDHPNPVTILRARRLLLTFFNTAYNATAVGEVDDRQSPASTSLGSASRGGRLGASAFQSFRARTRPNFELSPRPQLSMRRFSRAQSRLNTHRARQTSGGQLDDAARGTTPATPTAAAGGAGRTSGAKEAGSVTKPRSVKVLAAHAEEEEDTGGTQGAALEASAQERKPGQGSGRERVVHSDEEEGEEEIEVLGNEARQRIMEQDDRFVAGFGSADMAVIPRRETGGSDNSGATEGNEGGDGTQQGSGSGGSARGDEPVKVVVEDDEEVEPLQVSEPMLGYVCALLPIDEAVQESFVNPFGEFKYRHIISAAREESAALMLVMLCAKLSQSAHQLREQAFLLEFLAEFARLRPAPFALVEEELLQLVQRTLRRAQDPEMVRNCHRLIQHLVEATLKPQASTVTLHDLHFSGLWSASSFPSLTAKEHTKRLQLCGQILSQMLSETQRSRTASSSVPAPAAMAKVEEHGNGRLASLGVRREARVAASVHDARLPDAGDDDEAEDGSNTRHPTLELHDSSSLDSCV